jgi:hypothetical protein
MAWHGRPSLNRMGLCHLLLHYCRARTHYKSKEECCKEAAGNATADCDCKWDGYTWDNLPPPSAYSRMFTDECDGKPSVNRVSRTAVVFAQGAAGGRARWFLRRGLGRWHTAQDPLWPAMLPAQ